MTWNRKGRRKGTSGAVDVMAESRERCSSKELQRRSGMAPHPSWCAQTAAPCTSSTAFQREGRQPGALRCTEDMLILPGFVWIRDLHPRR